MDPVRERSECVEGIDRVDLIDEIALQMAGRRRGAWKRPREGDERAVVLARAQREPALGFEPAAHRVEIDEVREYAAVSDERLIEPAFHARAPDDALVQREQQQPTAAQRQQRLYDADCRDRNQHRCLGEVACVPASTL